MPYIGKAAQQVFAKEIVPDLVDGQDTGSALRRPGNRESAGVAGSPR